MKSAWLDISKPALKQLRELTFRATVSEAVRAINATSGTMARRKRHTYATYVFESFDGMTLGIKTKRPPESPQGPVPTLAFAVQPEHRAPSRAAGLPGPSEAKSPPRPSRSATPRPLRGSRVSLDCEANLSALRPNPPRKASQRLARRDQADEEATHDGFHRGLWRRPHRSLGDLCRFARPASLRDHPEDPPASHEDPQTPEFLGILRIGDLPHNLALAYPRPITFVGEVPEAYSWDGGRLQEIRPGRPDPRDQEHQRLARLKTRIALDTNSRPQCDSPHPNGA